MRMRLKVSLWCAMACVAMGTSAQTAAAAGPGCGAGQRTTAAKCKKDSDAGHVDDVVYLNAKEERTTCVVPITATEDPTNKTPTCKDIERDKNFLVQGRRAQFRVVNRKFFSDYSFNIDGVTQLKQIAIQDLEEAANLSAPVSSVVSTAPKGVAPKGLSTAGQLNLRTAHDLLAELLDEGTAANPASELESDALIVEREALNVRIQTKALDETWNLISAERENDDACRAGLGAPTPASACDCLNKTIKEEEEGDFDSEKKTYSNEDAFRKLTVEIGDRITMIQALGRTLQQNSPLMANQLSALDGSLAQWKADLNTLRANVGAAKDAVDAYESFVNEKRTKGKNDQAKSGSEDDVLTAMQKIQIKLKLIRDLNGGNTAAKPPLDDAEINRLVDVYWKNTKSLGRDVTTKQKDALKNEIVSIATRQIQQAEKNVNGDKIDIYLTDPEIITKQTSPVETAFENNQTHLTKDLPESVDRVNVAQSQMLARANEIYDLSAVPEPLDKWIDLSKNSGNLLVYYTVRRVDVFPRYTVPVVTLQGATPVPPVAPPVATTAAPAPPMGPDTSTGTVVAHGSLEVHDFYRATVVAGFAFSTIREHSVKSRSVTTGTATDGAACSTATPCSQPFLDKGSPIPAVVVGVNYYLSKHGHDTFPGAKRGIGQKLGIFGGIAANRFNSYFLGLGYEPSEAIQLTSGLNFVLQDSISGAYSASQAYSGSPSFGGRNAWSKGAYLGAGFNLSIFRKIFGSVTGLGTKASGGGS